MPHAWVACCFLDLPPPPVYLLLAMLLHCCACTTALFYLCIAYMAYMPIESTALARASNSHSNSQLLISYIYICFVHASAKSTSVFYGTRHSISCCAYYLLI
jgi:hypothetical protein